MPESSETSQIARAFRWQHLTRCRFERCPGSANRFSCYRVFPRFGRAEEAALGKSGYSNTVTANEGRSRTRRSSVGRRKRTDVPLGTDLVHPLFPLTFG